MRRLARVVAILAGVVIGTLMLWRRNPRIGARFMNEVVDPFLVRRGISGTARSELGTLEHRGRRSGARHLTPVHPEATDDGFRIVVPLGLKSEWAQNVLAAGHCRMQLRDTVYELDEPALLLPREMAELPTVTRWVFGVLGFMYMRLHRFAEHPGSLESIVVEPETIGGVATAGPASAEQPVPVTSVVAEG